MYPNLYRTRGLPRTLSANTKGFFDGLTAVSYTHLGKVYRRRTNQPGKTCAGGTAAGSRRLPVPSLLSVSYTHIDVYKRQSHTIHIEVPPNPFWASIGLSVTPLSLGSGVQYESRVWSPNTSFNLTLSLGRITISP